MPDDLPPPSFSLPPVRSAEMRLRTNVAVVARVADRVYEGAASVPPAPGPARRTVPAAKVMKLGDLKKAFAPVADEDIDADIPRPPAPARARPPAAPVEAVSDDPDGDIQEFNAGEYLRGHTRITESQRSGASLASAALSRMFKKR